MSKFVTKRLYDVHSGVGVVCGLLLYAIVWSGTLAVWSPHMTAWEVPESRVTPPAVVEIDAPVRSIIAEHDVRKGFVVVELPDDAQPLMRVWIPGRPRVAVDVPSSGDPPITWTPGWGEFHRRLHTNLHLPGPLGRWIIGLAGVAMMLMLVTGLVSDRRWSKDALTVRPQRAARTFLADVHKRIGLWSLPFSFVISLTGALLGLIQLVLVIGALAAFGGDQEAVIEAVVGEQVERADEPAAMVDIDPLVEDARAQLPGPPKSLLIQHYGDANARMSVQVSTELGLAERSAVEYALADGSVTRVTRMDERTPGMLITEGAMDLHYANFGGFALQTMYIVLGLALSAMIALGLSLWIRRRRQGQGTSDTHRRLERLNIGLVAGMPLASAVSLAASPLVPPGLDSMFTMAMIYTGTLAVTVAVAQRGTATIVHRRLWMTTGGSLLTALVLDALVQGPDLVVQLGRSRALATTYVGIALTAVLVLLIARRALPRPA